MTIKTLTGPSPLLPAGAIADDAPGPQAFLVEYPTPVTVTAHFHPVDQMQIVVAGEGAIGKHAVSPVSVHYTDGYTPYGPITMETGITFFNFRLRPDCGTHYMPGAREEMHPRKAGRSLVWDAPIRGEGQVAENGVEEGLKECADGTAAAIYSVRPADSIKGPDPRTGSGQFYVVIRGSALVNGSRLGRWSCIWVAPDEAAPDIPAGREGLDLLMVQFGRGRAGALITG